MPFGRIFGGINVKPTDTIGNHCKIKTSKLAAKMFMMTLKILNLNFRVWKTGLAQRSRCNFWTRNYFLTLKAL
jgi:hypothetical protein